jgi:hypothetical protein
VQLARRPDGRYRIIDDTGSSDLYWFIDDVRIEERRTKRGRVGAKWKFSPEQSEQVRDELLSLSEFPALSVALAEAEMAAR